MKISTLILLFLSIPFSALGWENCGQINNTNSNCEYQVENGTLTIRPIDNNADAIMPTYSYSYVGQGNADYSTTAPWYNDRDNITNIKIENGIQNISKDAFMELRQVTSVTMADSVTSIGRDAFTNAYTLNQVNLSKNLQTISGCAFQSTNSLTHIDLPEGLTTLGGSIFNFQKGATSLAIPDSLIDSQNFHIQALNKSKISTVYCSKEKEKACADYIKKAKDAGYAPEGLTYEVYEKYDNK